MYLLPEKKIAFYANPRTGSRTTADIMLRAGGFQLGGHHDSLEMHADGWLKFCVVRPPHEIIASTLYRSTRNFDEPAWMARLKGMMENWTKDGRFFWRDMYCNHVQVYPDIRVPGIDLEPGEIGMSGQGKAWKELLPDFVLHYIRHNGILQREYKKYGWSLP